LIKVENTPNAEMIRVKIAELWKLNGDHKNAVRSYLELAQLSKDQKKIQYLNAAISSQRILANWPAVAPWGGMAKGSPSERQQLLAIYSDLIGVYGDRINWDVVSHYGILSLEMGAEDQAFASWNKALSKNPRGPHASFAAGFMMVRYEGTKRWQDLENLARLCMKSGLSPQHRNKVLNPKAMLAMALLEGGKAHFNSGNFKLAVSKLEEFVKGFNTPNRDEGMFFLASAYRGNADHKKAIETLAAFSQQYPQSSYYRQAMLNGGNWSTAMAFEENAIYFHKGFLRRFGDDPEAKKIRPVLTQLYLGRRLYAEVLHVYQGQVDSRTSSNDERLRAMHGIMTIEASYGSMDRAVREADRLLSVTQNENFVADALNVKTKFYHSKNNFAELGRIESRLATMSNNQKVQDALSEVRFLLADRNNEQLFSPIDNLTLKNPLQIIQQRYAAFSKVRSGYEKVCSGGDSAYCAPALNQVARKAEQLLTIVEEVTIPETFDEKTVYGFDREKAKVLNTLASVASKADARASSMIERGFNDPVTTQQVLWQNADDWNFHRVSTEAGHAYIQWPVASKD
jgi:tetratricopeptide (TPR) repeat protein